MQSVTPEQPGNYNQVMNRLEQRYGHAHMQHDYCSQLRSRFQQTCEPTNSEDLVGKKVLVGGAVVWKPQNLYL